MSIEIVLSYITQKNFQSTFIILQKKCNWNGCLPHLHPSTSFKYKFSIAGSVFLTFSRDRSFGADILQS